MKKIIVLVILNLSVSLSFFEASNANDINFSMQANLLRSIQGQSSHMLPSQDAIKAIIKNQSLDATLLSLYGSLQWYPDSHIYSYCVSYQVFLDSFGGVDLSTVSAAFKKDQALCTYLDRCPFLNHENYFQFRRTACMNQ